MNYKLFIKNPFKYYFIYKRKQNICSIRYYKLFNTSIIDLWATKKVNIPLYNMNCNPLIEQSLESYKFIIVNYEE